jgi:hypothetical protein
MPRIADSGISLRAYDLNGRPVSGALLRVYEAGTTTPVTVYADEALSVPTTTPSNAAGVFSPRYLPSGIYKIDVVHPDTLASLPGYPIDNVTPGGTDMSLTVIPKRYSYTATAGQTAFTGADESGLALFYDAGRERVYLNGVLLLPGTDYTQTDSATITLASGASAEDVLTIDVARGVAALTSETMLRSFDIAAAWNIDLTGAEDSADGVRAARNYAISAGTAVMFPAGDYKDGATVYTRTGPVLLLTNTDQAANYAPWRSPQHAIRIQWDTGDDPGEDLAVPIYIQMRSYEGINADGVRVDHLSEGGVGTAFYGRIATSPTSNFGTALQGETRHEGGATSCANLESKTFSTAGNARGIVLKQATGSIQGWDVAHPISGEYVRAHPNPEGLLITGTVGATYAAGTPIGDQDDLSGTEVGDEGGWLTGIKFDAASMRAGGTMILMQPDTARGIDFEGDLSDFAIGLRGNAVSFDAANAVKMKQGTVGTSIVWEVSGEQRALLDLDSGPSFHLGGKRVISARQAAIADVPTGGSATAADNATAINTILTAMRAHGLIEPTS